MVPLDSSVYDESQFNSRSYNAFGNIGNIKRISHLEFGPIGIGFDEKYYTYMFEERVTGISERIKVLAYLSYYKKWLESIGHFKAKQLIFPIEYWENTLNKMCVAMSEMVCLDLQIQSSRNYYKDIKDNYPHNVQFIKQIDNNTLQWIKSRPHCIRLQVLDVGVGLDFFIGLQFNESFFKALEFRPSLSDGMKGFGFNDLWQSRNYCIMIEKTMGKEEPSDYWKSIGIQAPVFTFGD